MDGLGDAYPSPSDAYSVSLLLSPSNIPISNEVGAFNLADTKGR